MDLPYSGNDRIEAKATAQGIRVQVNYQANGHTKQSNKVIGVQDQHLIRTDPEDGWGGWCEPSSKPSGQNLSAAKQALVAPAADAGDAPQWPQAQNVQPGSIYITGDRISIDDGYTMVLYQRPDQSQFTCAWVK